MAEYREVIRMYNKMCSDHFASCDDCPMHYLKERCKLDSCARVMIERDVLAESVVLNYNEHHTETWKDRLIKMMPDANVDEIVTKNCPRDFFGKIAPDAGTPGCTNDCVRCWGNEAKTETE